MALVDDYHMQAGNFFHRADGRAIPGVDSYGAAYAIFEQGWIGPILCVDIPRAKLVKTCAEANLFFYPPKPLGFPGNLAEMFVNLLFWRARS